MTGRERVRQALCREKVDRVPWVPFVGCHAGSLLGVKARDYLQSDELVVRGVRAAAERYRPDGLPVIFDLQIEAEALGCELAWADENPPAVSSHPLANGKTLEDLCVPGPEDGRIKLALSAARRLREACPEIALYGLVTGPFTLALHLYGTEIFMQMFDAPQHVHSLLRFCGDVSTAMSEYYCATGCDVIAIVDPMTSQIGEDQFKHFVAPYARQIFSHIRKKGALSSFFVCGHGQQNIAAMCACEPDNISVDENIPLDYVREVCGESGVSFGGNLQLTSVLLLGKPVDAQRNAVACMDVGGDRGYILSPGCDLPYSTPPENIAAITEIVEDPYQRDVVRALVRQHTDEDQLDLSEYGQTDRVIVDIITLDSEACAPCQYMLDAVKRVAPEFEGIVEWREHKIKYRESLVFMASLMVRNVPTICIDGQITFVSRIPPRDELIAAIQRRINEKFRMKIQRRRTHLYVLGKSIEELDQVKANVEQAVTELGADIAVESVSDEAAIADFGVMPSQTPAVVMARFRLKSVKSVPEVTIVKEWIKDIL
jgi:uroporphyrinogen decarboxylase